jgi:ADP-ribosylation factor protein 1
MGNWIAKIFGSATSNVRIIMVGLDASGKTTILYQFKLGEVVSSVPTIGFNVETVEYKKLKFMVWDIGGQDKIRLLWRHYFANTDAIIYVVDSADDRLDLAKEELAKMISEPDLEGVPILIFANKQDLGIHSVSQIQNALGLHEVRDRQWYIQGCSAISCAGLYEGLDKLKGMIEKSKKAK